ncbi:hypothetical protein [Microbacterium gorillae]|uniref:hypothetical protein n=1 Tax=Microbacterium gorillae TaxID=1231063 RepID=UPI003D95989A
MSSKDDTVSPRGDSAAGMRKRRPIRSVYPIITSVLLALSLVSCASPQDRRDATPPPSQETVATSSEILGDWGSLGLDVEPVTNTSEILQWSDIAVTGTISGYVEGSYVARTNGVVVKPVIASIENVTVQYGDLPKQSDGVVYVALIAPAGVEAVSRSVPPGTPVALYGWQINAPEGEGDEPGSVEGIPDGQPLYGSAHPAGLVFQLVSHDKPILVWPELGGVAPGLTLDDVLPGHDLKIIEDEATYRDAFD